MQHAHNSFPNAQQVVDYWLDDSITAPAAAFAQKGRWYRGGSSDAVIEPVVDHLLRVWKGIVGVLH